MPAKLSSPRANRRLILANLLVYGALAGTIVSYSEQIGWGWRSFQAYRAEEGAAEFQLTADQSILTRAEEALQAGQFEQAIAIADDALAIEPYSKAWLLKAVAARQLDQQDRAIEFLRRYIEIDPSLADPYLDIARIHFRRQDFGAAEAILRLGIDEFQRRSAAYTPRIDASAQDGENSKAVDIHRSYVQSLQRLESALVRVDEARRSGE